MADYFFLLDANAHLKDGDPPARPRELENARRSFLPCRSLCESLLPAAHEFRTRYHSGDDEPLLALVLNGLTFDRHIWRSLVSECLLFAAVEIPEFQVCAETLCCLLAPDAYRDEIHERASYAPIQQAHFGARDLTFGAAIYRPEHAGLNDDADVLRLADYLGGIDPNLWTIDHLAELRDVENEDRTEELEFAREWFPALVEMYWRAA